MVAIFAGSGTGFERGSGSVLGSLGLLGSSGLGRSGEQLFFNAATGNLVVSQRDEFLVGLGLDASVVRTYNSLGDLSDDNGDNWRQGYDKRIVGLTGTVNTAGSTVQRVSGDGAASGYTWQSASGKYATSAGAGAYDTLTFSGGVWTWTDGDTQVKETYSEYPAGSGSWRLTSQSDTDGNTISFAYTGDKLTQVTTADGSTITYTWAGNNLTSVTTGYIDLPASTAKTLTRTSYTYDGQNRLERVTVDLTPENASDSSSYVTIYTYDGTSKRVASISQSDGSYIAITYDGSGRVATMAETASTGVTRTTSVTYGAGYTEITDPLNLVTRLDYDAAKFLTKITLPPASAGAAQQQIQFTYQPNGDVTSVTDALGNVTTYSNFVNGLATTITDRLGNVINRTYGSKNELLTETIHASDQTQFDAPLTTRFVYDGENHLRYRVSAEGFVTEYRYRDAGEVEFVFEYPEHLYSVGALAQNQSPTLAQMDSWRDGLGDRSSTKNIYNIYDQRGNLSQSVRIGGNANGGIDSQLSGRTDTFFVYDQAGNLKSRFVQGRNVETFVYDGLNRLVSSVDVNGGTTTYVFNDAATTTTVTYATGLRQVSVYNKAGELLSFTEQPVTATTLGEATGTAWHGYDKNGRLRWSQDATGRKSYFVYDQLGRKIADISSLGNVIEYRYDANNRLIARIQYDIPVSAATLATLNDENAVIDFAAIRPAANDDFWQWHIYDKEGRLLQSIDGLGLTTIHVYDGAGRLIKSTNYANNVSTAQVEAFKTTPPTAVTYPWPIEDVNNRVSRNFYDKDGRLIGTLDGEGYLTQIVYDKAGQKTQVKAFANATTGDRVNGSFNTLLGSITLDAAKDRNTSCSYNGQGQLRYVIDSLGYVTETEYDSAGQATTVTQYAAALAATTDYSFDNVKALVASGGLPASAGTRKSWTVYDLGGRASYAIDAEGAVTSYGYNAAGQLKKTIRYAVPRTTTSMPSVATMDSWQSVNESPTLDRVTRFYYDGVGVLRYTVDAEGYVSRVDYDAEGRETHRVSWANKVTVGDSTTTNDVHSLVTSSGGTSADTWTSYDALGRVETITDAEGSITRYSYRNNGPVYEITKAWGTADATITRFAYDFAGRVAVRYDALGTAEQAATSYGYDAFGNVLTVTDPNNKVTTRTYDKLGQMLTETDPLNGVVAYQYDAFGHAVKVTDKLGRSTYNYYDKLGRLTAVRDAEDYVTETSYTVFGEVYRVIRRYNRANNAASTSVYPTFTIDARDAITTFEYDKLGRLTKTIDAEGYYEQYTLNAFGSRVSVRNKLGGVINNAYDRRGLLISESLPMAAYRSDGTAQATSVTNKFEYDARGNRTRMIEAFGLSEQRTTNYLYDRLNRLRQKSHDVGTTVSYGWLGSSSTLSETVANNVTASEWYTYDAAGRLKSTANALGGRTVYFYDDLGRKTAEVSPVGTFTEWTYDAAGNMKTQRVWGDPVAVPSDTASKPAPVNANNYRETTYEYDALNRLKGSAIANVLVGSWDGSGVSTTVTPIYTWTEYDANGNVLKASDLNGNATYSYYDKLGRKSAQVDAENYITTWTYDGEGNVLSETRFATKYVGTPPLGGTAPTVASHADDRITSFTYDRNGHRLTETRANVNIATVNTVNGAITESTVSSTIVYTYNGLGQVLSKAEATGDAVAYTYDATGRLIVEQGQAFVDHTGNTKQRHALYFYNGLNDLARTEVGAGDPSTGVGGSWAVVGTGDFNGDGRSDILWRDGSGLLTNWLGRTDGAFDGNWSNFNTTVTTDWKVAGTGDFNGDGRDDILWRNDDGRLTNWLANANGSFTFNDANAATGVPTDWKVGGTGDFNGDGRDDILWRRDNGQVSNWLGTSTGGFFDNGAVAGSAAGVEWKVAGTGDFNGDGRDDILWRNDAGHVTNWLSMANGVFAANWNNFNISIPSDWKIVGTGDFNADGRDDIAWRRDDGSFTTWSGQANGAFAGNDTYAWSHMPANWSVTGIGDFNGDGRADLAWMNAGVFKSSTTQVSGSFRPSGATVAPRVTTYAYGANGRLASTTDPSGATHNYYYDAAGNLTRDSYWRLKSDGTSVLDGSFTNYDLAGRAIATAMATYGTSWTRGDVSETEYNSYGDVSRRGINGLWQENFHYDNAGRLIKTNSGDGVWRFFVYDKNGNKTLTLESEGTDLQNLSHSDALNLARPGGVSAGAAFVDGINVTIAAYDKRGQALSTIMPQRELKAGDPRVTLTTSQTYNAFGEVKSSTDARGFTTDFTYNTMGRLIKKELPAISWLNESNVVGTARPTEFYYYDNSGRLVASKDANGNLISRTLLAGSGYGDSEALVTAEYHADGGIARIFYDQFGDARILRNELNQDETRTYDSMGRLITQTHRGGLLTDYYSYDLLGQRIKHWNSFLGTGNVERTDYDLQGRVVSQVAFGGDVTTTGYAWASVNSGVGSTGGFTSTTTYANGKTLIQTTDIFGREISKTDLGGHVFNYSYDKAGRQITRTTAGETLTNSWLNIGLIGFVTFGPGEHATYGYDANGNRLSERTERGNVLVQNATAQYNALGWLTSWSDSGGIAPASKTIEYDLNGNVRRTISTFRYINTDGTVTTAEYSQGLIFRYDSMNRVVVSDRGWYNNTEFTNSGKTISYYLNGLRASIGERTSATTTYANPNWDPDPSLRNDPSNPRTITAGYEAHTREDFSYDGAGNLNQVSYGVGGASVNTETGEITPLAVTSTTPVATLAYDAMGRLTRQQDWLNYSLADAAYDRTVTYNDKGQITNELVISKTKNGSSYDEYRNEIANNFGSGASYALGAVVSTTSHNYKNHSDGDSKDTSTSTTFQWWDGGVASVITHDFDTGSSGTDYSSTHSYSVSGQLNSVSIVDGRSRTVTYVNDMNGQIIRRQEADSQSGGDPHDIWYRYNGVEMGTVSNNGSNDLGAPSWTSGNAGVTQTSYKASINSRTAPSAGTGAFRNGSTSGTSYSDFDRSYEPINSYRQGSAGGRYTVQGGESLQAIAQAVWGDASLWYKLAEANGLSADAPLVAGQTLTLPSGVVRTHNNASTFKPYDTAEAIGNVSPTTPKPPKNKKCGMFGAILLVAIAVAVTVVTAGAAAAAMTPGLSLGGGIASVLGLSGATALSTGVAIGAGAIGGAVGSIVSQGVGVATGIQDKFSWKGVALSALAGGIGGGFGKVIQGGGFLAGAARGVATSVATQGIAVATGLQKKFSWAGVAAAGVSGGVGAEVGGKLGEGFWEGMAASGAAAIAGAATRSALEGSSFGDNILAMIPDVIGSALGNAAARGIAGKTNGLVLNPVKESPVAHTKPTIGKLTEQIIAKVGWQTERTADGKLRILNYDSAALSQQQGQNGELYYIDEGHVIGDETGQAFRDTVVTEGLIADGVQDLGGLTFTFSKPGGWVRSQAFGIVGDTGAVRVLQNGSGAFLYEGGDVTFAELGFSVSYGEKQQDIVVTGSRLAKADAAPRFTTREYIDTNRRLAARYRDGMGDAGFQFGLTAMEVGENAPQVRARFEQVRANGITGSEALQLGIAALGGAPALGRKGRSGRQARLRELAQDPKVSSADRGWIQQEMNSIARGQRRNIRVPPGKVLAHRRGFEAKLGYSYEHSDLQLIDLHKLQHKHEGY